MPSAAGSGNSAPVSNIRLNFRAEWPIIVVTEYPGKASAQQRPDPRLPGGMDAAGRYRQKDLSYENSHE